MYDMWWDDTNIVWGDFAFAGEELGTDANPVNSVVEALGAVPSGGTIKIKGDTADSTTAETGRLTQVVRIEAVNGAVAIGK